MQRIRHILGWLMIVPLTVNALAELYVLALIVFQGSDNDQRFITLTFGAFPLLVTGPLAIVGWRLTQGGSRRPERDQTISAEAVTPRSSTTRASAWVLIAVSLAVMAFALLVAVLDLTNLVSRIEVMAVVGIWILAGVPLAAGINRIREIRRLRSPRQRE